MQRVADRAKGVAGRTAEPSTVIILNSDAEPFRSGFKENKFAHLQLTSGNASC